jgi:hypothetical protein
LKEKVKQFYRQGTPIPRGLNSERKGPLLEKGKTTLISRIKDVIIIPSSNE